MSGKFKNCLIKYVFTLFILVTGFSLQLKLDTLSYLYIKMNKFRGLLKRILFKGF